MPNNEAAATSETSIACKFEYLRTIQGMLKMSEVALGLTTLICGAIGLGPQGGWGAFVGGVTFAVSLVLFLFYFTNFVHKMPVGFPMWETIYYAVACAMFFSASTACAVGGLWPPYAAYAFFGYIATIAYGIDAYIHFNKWRRTGQNNQSSVAPAKDQA